MQVIRFQNLHSPLTIPFLLNFHTRIRFNKDTKKTPLKQNTQIDRTEIHRSPNLISDPKTPHKDLI